MISCHNFLFITSTSPPLAMTKLYNSYKSSTDLAIIGRRLMGDPENIKKKLISKLLKLDVTKKSHLEIFHLIDYHVDNKIHK